MCHFCFQVGIADHTITYMLCRLSLNVIILSHINPHCGVNNTTRASNHHVRQKYGKVEDDESGVEKLHAGG